MKSQAEWDSLALRALATSLPGPCTVGSGTGLGFLGERPSPGQHPGVGALDRRCRPVVLVPAAWDLGPHDTHPSRAPASGLPGPGLAQTGARRSLLNDRTNAVEVSSLASSGLCFNAAAFELHFDDLSSIRWNLRNLFSFMVTFPR